VHGNRVDATYQYSGGKNPHANLSFVHGTAGWRRVCRRRFGLDRDHLDTAHFDINACEQTWTATLGWFDVSGAAIRLQSFRAVNGSANGSPTVIGYALQLIRTLGKVAASRPAFNSESCNTSATTFQRWELELRRLRPLGDDNIRCSAMLARAL
jgi:hypothetical protein